MTVGRTKRHVLTLPVHYWDWFFDCLFTFSRPLENILSHVAVPELNVLFFYFPLILAFFKCMCSFLNQPLIDTATLDLIFLQLTASWKGFGNTKASHFLTMKLGKNMLAPIVFLLRASAGLRPGLRLKSIALEAFCLSSSRQQQILTPSQGCHNDSWPFPTTRSRLYSS